MTLGEIENFYYWRPLLFLQIILFFILIINSSKIIITNIKMPLINEPN